MEQPTIPKYYIPDASETLDIPKLELFGDSPDTEQHEDRLCRALVELTKRVNEHIGADRSKKVYGVKFGYHNIKTDSDPDQKMSHLYADIWFEKP